jgi:hypothetical protein
MVVQLIFGVLKMHNKDYFKEHYRKNREKRLAYQKEYYQKNKERCRERNKLLLRKRYEEIKENGRLNTFG